jgi:dTDP-4-dehydrorhamnose 3,5-epimerase-like enzyme
VTFALADVQLIKMPHVEEDNGELVFMEGAHIPFAIVRVFLVSAPAGAVRGMHSHKKCSQFMFCTAGRVNVSCEDGVDSKTFLLSSSSTGLLVPPGIWATQTYLEDKSALMVLCDRRYEEEDYIRDYADFKNSRAPSPGARPIN